MSDARGAASWDAERAPSAVEVAYADANYVLRWLRQSESPANIIGLQERAASVLAECGRLRERVRRLEKRADGFREVAKRQADKRASEVGRLREQLDALREAFRTYVDATTFKSSLPDDVGSPNAPTRNAWAVARAALGVEGEQEPGSP